MFSTVTNIISGIGQIFSAKYYVTQQLAQMQAHNLNRPNILKNATGKSKNVIKEIFEKYDELIDVKNWGWVRKGNKAYAVKLEDGEFIDAFGLPQVCSNEMHLGIFPPTPAVIVSLPDCRYDLDFKENYYEGLREEVTGFAELYASDIEYYVLTLEALLQDMAISNPDDECRKDRPKK
jgi:hypothetical protein